MRPAILLIFYSLIHCCEGWPFIRQNRLNYDFIVVGAGAAGSALAARLSEDARHRVLLLEAGGEPEHLNKIPYFSPGPYTGILDWKYYTKPQKRACLSFKDDTCFIPTGKGLGGSTLVNGMVYTRGNARDYDHWRDLGNKGWGYKDVVPFFEKLENIHDESLQNDSSRGKGPVSITPSPYKPELEDTFLAAGRELGYQDMHKGFSRTYFTMKHGMRFSTYDAYLKEARSRRNLHVITHALVTKVIFDQNKRATGVEFQINGTRHEANARKEVILSAGALRSPHILLLSGIGPEKELRDLKIPVVKNLPGVGKNLEDHTMIEGLFITLKKQIGFRWDKDVTSDNFEKLEIDGNGPLSAPQRLLATADVDSDYADKSIDWPDLELMFFQLYRQGRGFRTEEYELRDDQFLGKNVLFSKLFLLRGKSHGSITLKSSDPTVDPVVDPNYLSSDYDVKRLVSGVKIFLKIAQTKALKKYGAYTNFNTSIKGCENYELMSDEYLACFIRYYAKTGNHFSGTCKMGVENDSFAVVDHKLRVYGVTNLRVADDSICPTGISGHLMAPAIMIGEKAAHDIKVDWKE